jgi:hypothetical protein
VRCSRRCIFRPCFENYRQCFDKDEVIFGGGQGWMSQRGCGLFIAAPSPIWLFAKGGKVMFVGPRFRIGQQEVKSPLAPEV